MVALCVRHLRRKVVDGQKRSARNRTRLALVAERRQGRGQRICRVDVGERTGKPFASKGLGTEQICRVLPCANVGMAVPRRIRKRELPVERVLLREFHHRDVDFHELLRHVQFTDELFVHPHARLDVAHDHRVKSVLGADQRTEPDVQLRFHGGRLVSDA